MPSLAQSWIRRELGCKYKVLLKELLLTRVTAICTVIKKTPVILNNILRLHRTAIMLVHFLNGKNCRASKVHSMACLPHILISGASGRIATHRFLWYSLGFNRPKSEEISNLNACGIHIYVMISWAISSNFICYFWNSSFSRRWWSCLTSSSCDDLFFLHGVDICHIFYKKLKEKSDKFVTKGFYHNSWRKRDQRRRSYGFNVIYSTFSILDLIDLKVSYRAWKPWKDIHLIAWRVKVCRIYHMDFTLLRTVSLWLWVSHIVEPVTLSKAFDLAQSQREPVLQPKTLRLDLFSQTTSRFKIFFFCCNWKIWDVMCMICFKN